MHCHPSVSRCGPIQPLPDPLSEVDLPLGGCRVLTLAGLLARCLQRRYRIVEGLCDLRQRFPLKG